MNSKQEREKIINFLLNQIEMVSKEVFPYDLRNKIVDHMVNIDEILIDEDLEEDMLIQEIDEKKCDIPDCKCEEES